MKKSLVKLLALTMVFVTVLCGCGKGETSEPAAESSKTEQAETPVAEEDAKKTDFVVAIETDITGFDMMISGANAGGGLFYHVFEQLAMLDYTSKLMPQLATSWETNEDDTVWTLKLKEGVVFHDGTDFDAEDVLASLERYARIGQRKSIFEGATFEALDDFTVKITLGASNPLFMEALGTQGLGGIVMLPAEHCGPELDTTFGQADCIGTGPYKLDSFEPNTHVILRKHDAYIPDTQESNGFCGERIANFETITWKIVPDAAQRLNGLLAGEYQYAKALNATAYSTLEATEGVEVDIVPGAWIPFTAFNSINSPFSDIKLRQALILCLDMEECMLATVAGNEALMEMSHSMFFEDQIWYSEVGSEWYNQNNDEKAKELVAESGYNGEPLKWVVTQDYQWMYDVAVVVQQQAEEVGINIELEVYDWATCVSKMFNGQKEKEFDLWTSGFSYPDVVDPTGIDGLFTLDTEWPYESEEMDAIVKSGHSSDEATRVEAYHGLVEQWYEDMFGIIYGKISNIGGYSSDVELCQQYAGLRFFNCSYK